MENQTYLEVIKKRENEEEFKDLTKQIEEQRKRGNYTECIHVNGDGWNIYERVYENFVLSKETWMHGCHTLHRDDDKPASIIYGPYSYSYCYCRYGEYYRKPVVGSEGVIDLPTHISFNLDGSISSEMWRGRKINNDHPSEIAYYKSKDPTSKYGPIYFKKWFDLDETKKINIDIPVEIRYFENGKIESMIKYWNETNYKLEHSIEYYENGNKKCELWYKQNPGYISFYRNDDLPHVVEYYENGNKKTESWIGYENCCKPNCKCASNINFLHKKINYNEDGNVIDVITN